MRRAEGIASSGFGRGWRVALWIALVLAAVQSALAGGPRFVTGTKYSGAQSGQMMAFYTSTPLYFTDPGDLNAAVPHAQADAMVAAAASVWNVPSSSLVLTQGGTLSEQVDGNVTFNGTQVQFPPDVEASNYLNIPIAVIYDMDGSVIDLLLGEGASDPVGCRQTGVVESVDGFGQNGKIQHAMLILNGRCVGSTPQQMLQMQYQVMRAFGRILGLSWSQLNDNVFTGAMMPTASQMQYWPVMHPIDVICGAYTYQCMTSAFTLRPDDVNTLTLLYPVTSANLTTGKTLSSQGVVNLLGQVLFPSGQGMELVNVAVHRLVAGHDVPEPWQVVSSVTGALYQQNVGNPVTGPESNAENAGVSWGPDEGAFQMPHVPDTYVANLYMTTEPVNPLYSGEYAVGPYQRPAIAPSGATQTVVDWSAVNGTSGAFNATMKGAAAAPTGGSDGTQSSPAAADPSGWWKGVLYASGHTSWWRATIKAGRSWTMETTALDETGAATVLKVQPVMGVWTAGTGGLPNVASAAVPMNAMAAGVTQLQVSASATISAYTIAVADQFGAGRPDFAYQARLLYADQLSPATVGQNGGQFTITGSGFRQGNSVLVNGVNAAVVSLSSTQIVATAPSVAAAGGGTGVPLDVEVYDGSTGGSTTISAALSYTTVPAYTVAIVSAPAALETGIAMGSPVIAEVLDNDGQPVAGASVLLSVSAGSATLAACGGAASCTVVTGSNGEVQTAVTGDAAGTVTLTATELSGGVSGQVTWVDRDPVRAVIIQAQPGYAAAGAAESWTLGLVAMQDGLPAAGAAVTWTASAGLSLIAADVSTSANGTASVSISTTAVPVGASSLTGCVWGGPCATWTLYGVTSSQWVVTVVQGAGQSLAAGQAFAPVTFLVTDGAGHALLGAPVTVYQTVDGWEGACPAQGRCPAAPVLTSSQASFTTGADGLVVASPVQVPGLPQVVNLAAATGTQGFATLSITESP